MSVADNVLESCTTCPAVESSHEEVGSQVRHNSCAHHGSESNPTTKHQQLGAVFTDDKLDQLNTLSLAAGTIKTTEATVNLQVGNHNSLTMSGHISNRTSVRSSYKMMCKIFLDPLSVI